MAQKRLFKRDMEKKKKKKRTNGRKVSRYEQFPARESFIHCRYGQNYLIHRVAN